MSSRKNCPLRLKTRAWTWLAYVSPRTMWHLPLRPRISSSPRSKTLGFSPPTSSATLSGGLPARPVAAGGADGARGVRGPEISRYMARTARARNRKISARNRYLRIVRATWGTASPSLSVCVQRVGHRLGRLGYGRGRRLRRGRGLLGGELQLAAADLDAVPRRKPPLLDQASVDERAVGRVEVDEPPAVLPLHQLGMLARGVGIVEGDLAGRQAAHDQPARVQHPFLGGLGAGQPQDVPSQRLGRRRDDGVGVVLGPHLEPSRRHRAVLVEVDNQGAGEVPAALGGAAAQQGAELLLK